METTATAGRRFLGDLPLESGETLPDVSLAYTAYGTLDADARNAVLVFHGLTASSHAASTHAGDEAGWWERVIGPGRGIDTDLWYVVVPDVLGGTEGSTGPRSPRPDGEPWAETFPGVSIRDQVAATRRLGESLGVARWAAVVGPSFGGMHALEWHVGHPEAAERVAVIAAPAESTAEHLAQNRLQIDIVRADPDFHDGRYAAHGVAPTAGLELARRSGMLGYRGADEMHGRFGRTRSDHGFLVDDYFLRYARQFAARFDANSYLALTHAKSTHDIGRGRGGVVAALNSVSTPLLVVAISSDQLFPPALQRSIAAASPGSITGAEPLVLDSPHGHDSFLVEQEWMSDTLGAFLSAEAFELDVTAWTAADAAATDGATIGRTTPGGEDLSPPDRWAAAGRRRARHP